MKRLTTYILLVLAYCQIGKAQPICNVTEYGENDGLAQWHVTQIVQDKQGMIWMSTWNGLNRFDGQSFHCFKSLPGDGCNMYTDRIRNIWIDSNDNIQCMVDYGNYMFDTKTYRFSESDSTKTMPNKSISLKNKKYIEYTDNYGTKWLLHNNGKLEYIDRKSGETVEYPLKSLTNDYKFCFNDKQGNLWLYGNYNIFKLSFSLNPTETLPQKEPGEIRSLMLDSKNRYWVSNRDDKTVRLFAADNSLIGYLDRNGRISKSYVSFGSPVYCITQTSNGTIWMGSKPDGLFRLSETANGTFGIRQIEGLNNNNVYDIKEDRLGRLWLATLGGGINCLPHPHDDAPEVVNSGNGFANYPEKDFLKTRNILIVNDSAILASSTDGLIVVEIQGKTDLKKARFHRHTRDANRASSLSCNATMFVSRDNRGRIFVCTESGGLNMITSGNLFADTLSFKHFNTNSGLPTDVMLSATPLDSMLLVVCSNRILLLNPDDSSHSAYDSRFFQQRCRFSDALPLQLPDGRWLLATHDGAFTIDRRMIRKSDFVPPIALTSISIENRRTEMAVNSLDTLLLNSDERNATINFAALDYSYGSSISYAFRLNEADDEKTGWNNIGHDRSVTLLNLMPETYHLEIRSTNGDGVWTDNNRLLTIIVKPKWHETMFARILFLLVSLAVIALIVYTIIYIKRINKRQDETLQAYLALLSSHEDMKVSGHEVATLQSYKDESSNDLITSRPHNLATSPEDDAFMRRVVAFVEENIGNADVSISDMADAAAVSRSGLQRKMKHLMGITPLDFLREARIKRACQLLEQSSKPVSDIAYECGFSDPKYFSRSFKTSTGKSPSDYRK